MPSKQKCTGTDKAFEEACQAAGIPIYSRCACGSTFCQHDMSVRAAFNDYSSDTRGAYLMWKYLKREESQNER